MTPTDEELAESTRRVRRGCIGSAALFVGLAVLFVSSTGNLFYLLFLIGAVIALVLWRLLK